MVKTFLAAHSGCTLRIQNSWLVYVDEVSSYLGIWDMEILLCCKSTWLVSDRPHHTTPYEKIVLDDEEHEAESCEGLYLLTEKIKP